MNEDTQNNDMNTETTQNIPAEQTPSAGQVKPENTAREKTSPAEPEAKGTILSGAGAEEGAPETYDFTPSLPEGAELDEETASAFGEICKGMNLTNDQANKLAAYGYQYASRIMEQHEQALQEQAKELADQTRKELGANYEATVAKAGTAMRYLERNIPGIRELFAASPVFNDPKMIRAVAMIGDLISEDPGAGGSGRTSSDDWNPYPNSHF